MIAPGAGGDFGVKHGPVGDMIVHQAISMLIMRGVSNSIFALDPGCQVRLHDGRLSLKSFGKIICLCGGDAQRQVRRGRHQEAPGWRVPASATATGWS
jgi:hypothetical protein